MGWLLYILQCIVMAGTLYARCPFNRNLIGSWDVLTISGQPINATITFGENAVFVHQHKSNVFMCQEIDVFERALLVSSTTLKRTFSRSTSLVRSIDRKGIICLSFPFLDDINPIMVRLSPHYVRYSDFFNPTTVRYYRPSIMNTCNRYKDAEMVLLKRRSK